MSFVSFLQALISEHHHGTYTICLCILTILQNNRMNFFIYIKEGGTASNQVRVDFFKINNVEIYI